MEPRFAFLFLAGGAIRLLLLLNSSKLRWMLENVAVSTPLNSWKRVTEGIFLHGRNVSPYSGDVFHDTPIFLLVFEWLSRTCDWVLPLVFVACDLLTALILAKCADTFAKDLLLKQKKEVKQYHHDAIGLLPKAADLHRLRVYVAAAYLFHPYATLSCAAMTTTVFSNLILAISLFSTMKRNSILMCASLALATYQHIYPVMLLLPCSLHVAQKGRGGFGGILGAIFCLVTLFGTFLASLLFLSFYKMGNWEFLRSVYGCIMNVDDLTPNIGLFWYFFTEMFDHFRLFFIYTFQINAFVYVIPLMIRFPNDNALVMFTLHGLMCIFKSYPSIGDIALYTSLLPIWAHLYPFMRQTFVIGCFFLTCSVLAPVLFQLWIFYGSANANFFFGTTLAFNAAQIFLISDVLFAYVKREYHLKNGLTLIVDSEPGKLTLK